jgi:hypothetical protein
MTKIFLSIIYGIIFFTILYFIAKLLFQVYYTPGSTVLYNSPVTQSLFPGEKNKLFPSWGYNSLGMYKGDATKYGQDDFWPTTGKNYEPDKYGYGGPSPSGGERKTMPIPDEVNVGFWGKTPAISNTAIIDIYDISSQHVEYDTPIGWWNE